MERTKRLNEHHRIEQAQHHNMNNIIIATVDTTLLPSFFKRFVTHTLSGRQTVTHPKMKNILCRPWSVICVCLLIATTASSFQPGASSPCKISTHRTNNEKQGTTTGLSAAPEEALHDIVVPNVFNFGISSDDLANEDPRVWVPQTDCLSFRPLCFCTSQGCEYLLLHVECLVYMFHVPVLRFDLALT